MQNSMPKDARHQKIKSHIAFSCQQYTTPEGVADTEYAFIANKCDPLNQRCGLTPIRFVHLYPYKITKANIRIYKAVLLQVRKGCLCQIGVVPVCVHSFP